MADASGVFCRRLRDSFGPAAHEGVAPSGTPPAGTPPACPGAGVANPRHLAILRRARAAAVPIAGAIGERVPRRPSIWWGAAARSGGRQPRVLWLGFGAAWRPGAGAAWLEPECGCRAPIVTPLRAHSRSRGSRDADRLARPLRRRRRGRPFVGRIRWTRSSWSRAYVGARTIPTCPSARAARRATASGSGPGPAQRQGTSRRPPSLEPPLRRAAATAAG